MVLASSEPPDAETGPLFDAALSGLHHAVGAVLQQDISSDPDAVIAERLTTIRREIDRLEGEFCRSVERFEHARGFAADGATSATSWLRAHCHMSGGAAAQRVEVSRRLPVLPETESDLRTGEIGFEHAAVMARCATRLGPEAMRVHEGTLVTLARHVDPRMLRMATMRVRMLVDQDGELRIANEQYERRELHVSAILDGMFKVDGLLDAEGGALLCTALQALQYPVARDTRPVWQRRADALVELARRQLDAGALPARHGVRPHLTLTVPEATLRDGEHGGAGEVRGVGPVVDDFARRIACDATLTRVTLAAAGSQVEVSRAHRAVGATLGRALDLRDEHCVFPGCDRPPDWCDAHHIQHRADHGKTKLSNLVLLCRVHHRVVHEGGHRLVRAETGGSINVLPPLHHPQANPGRGS